MIELGSGDSQENRVGPQLFPSRYRSLDDDAGGPTRHVRLMRSPMSLLQSDDRRADACHAFEPPRRHVTELTQQHLNMSLYRRFIKRCAASQEQHTDARINCRCDCNVPGSESDVQHRAQGRFSMGLVPHAQMPWYRELYGNDVLEAATCLH